MTGAQRRQQLLDVGRALFADKGFEGATIEEIAEVPGIGQRTATAIAEAVAAEPKPVSVNTATGEIVEAAHDHSI